MTIVREINGKVVEMKLPENCREATIEDLRAIEESKQAAKEREIEMMQRIKDRKRHSALKAELAKVMEDVEQEQLGFVRDDYVEKKMRAAEIINELRVLEGKEQREII